MLSHTGVHNQVIMWETFRTQPVQGNKRRTDKLCGWFLRDQKFLRSDVLTEGKWMKEKIKEFSRTERSEGLEDEQGSSTHCYAVR